MMLSGRKCGENSCHLVERSDSGIRWTSGSAEKSTQSPLKMQEEEDNPASGAALDQVKVGKKIIL